MLYMRHDFFRPIFNACYTRQLLTQLCCGNSMLHETTFYCNMHNSGNNVIILQLFELQHVAATKCCVKSRPVRHAIVSRNITYIFH